MRGRKPKNAHGGKTKERGFKLGDEIFFALRWLSAVDAEGESQTAIVERLIKDAADKQSKATGQHWLEFYHPEEAVRRLTLMALPGFRSGAKEARVHAFVRAHAPFFYIDGKPMIPHPARAVILWPHLWGLTEMWERDRANDMWCAAKEMVKLLKPHREPAPNGKGRW